jgi:hypothetical protein
MNSVPMALRNDTLPMAMFPAGFRAVHLIMAAA